MRNFVLVSALAAVSLLAAAEPSNGSGLPVQLLGGIPFAPGDPLNGGTVVSAVSADERFLLLSTGANNQAPGIVDVNQRPDFYVLDRTTETYDLITRSATHPQRTVQLPEITISDPLVLPPWNSFMSDDGRWVAFSSSSKDLVAGTAYPAPGAHDTQVYLFDRVSRNLQLISHAWGDLTTASSDGVRLFAMSADGRFIAFESFGANLTAAGIRQQQVYLFDRQSGQTIVVSHPAGAPGSPSLASSAGGRMTPDGRYLTLTSRATDLVAGQIDGPDTDDAFLYILETDTFELLSRASGQPLTAVGGRNAELSNDGRFATLSSNGVALVAGLEDGNGELGSDCFLLDREAGTARLVSRSVANAARSAASSSSCSAASESGRHVFFTSNAADLVAGFVDNNQGRLDAYVFDAVGGQVTLASHAAGSPNESADDMTLWTSGVPSALRDRYQILSSGASDLQAGVIDDSGFDSYLYDLEAGTSTLISRVGTSLTSTGVAVFHHFSSDEASILFSSESADPAFPSARFSQVYRFDIGQEAVTLAPRTTLTGTSTDDLGIWTMLDEDGRYFGRWGQAFDAKTSEYRSIVHAAGDVNIPANSQFSRRLDAVSTDGRFFTYTTDATNVAPIADTNGKSDVFVYDRNFDAPQLISHAFGNSAIASSGESYSNWTSDDGSRLILSSRSNNLVSGFTAPTNAWNLFFYDRGAGSAELISHAAGAPATGTAGLHKLETSTANGLLLAYTSNAANLVPSFFDRNSAEYNLYFYDRSSHQATLVDRRPGPINEGSAGRPGGVRMTADGSALFFHSHADDLVVGQHAQPGTSKVFRWNRATGANELVIYAPGNPGRPCAGTLELADISPNGRWVLVWGTCQLVAGDTNGSDDVYLHDRLTDSTILISHQPGDPAASLAVDAEAFDLSDNARRIVFAAGGVPMTYDRASRQSRPLLTAYYDPELPFVGKVEAASTDGSRILLTSGTHVVPFDADTHSDSFLVTLDDLFADGFESGDTAAWSQAIP